MFEDNSPIPNILSRKEFVRLKINKIVFDKSCNYLKCIKSYEKVMKKIYVTHFEILVNID